ncbi:MAG: LLM class F420-dependent oxidoreductase [Deltaproteobacteria bacterium]|nr:LLM class F420-dependent oxidoreductase [Deltaproteobacteria bacterium]
MKLGRIGIWAFLDMLPAAEAQAAAREVEDLGFEALWIPEAIGREIFTSSAILLAGTKKLAIATGIANVWARDAMAMANAQRTLCEAYPERFLLGIGVSHAPLIDAVRGHHYAKPLTYMRKYLDAMDQAPFAGAPPPSPPRRVIAALHPKMLELAREKSWGSHPYFVPPEHTARARKALGADRLLAPEQAVVLETDPAKARAIARQHMAIYLGLPNYCRNLLTLGFTQEDLASGGSDRLVDAIVAWGDVETVRARVKAHHDAGADHVCLQALEANMAELPRGQWRQLAKALL